MGFTITIKALLALISKKCICYFKRYRISQSWKI